MRWEISGPHYQEPTEYPPQIGFWYIEVTIPRHVDGIHTQIVGTYRLNPQRRPNVHGPGLRGWGLTEEQIRRVKEDANKIWELWLPVAKIVSGARP